VHHLLYTIPAALLPTVVLVWYFQSKDVHREPQGVLIRTFAYGCLIVVPVLCVELPLLFLVVIPLVGINPVAGAIAGSVLAAAIPEEFFKFLVVFLYCSRQPAFDEPMDGVVYGAIASLGFASLENILYVWGGGYAAAVSRALTAVPCHAFLGAIMGYYIARARFSPSRKGVYLATGLGLAILFHALYDAPLLILHDTGDVLLSKHPLLAVGLGACSFGVLIVLGTWTVFLVQRLHNEQLLHQPPPPTLGGGEELPEPLP
jgi:RsiW-degrading membrane proteinase PrsW (M82 family)